jgi:hypothetical protein
MEICSSRARVSEKIGHPSWRGSSTLKSDLALTLAPLCFSPCIIRESNRDARVAAEQAWIIDGSRFPQLIVFGILLPVVAIIPAWAQDNYEIQVYGSDLVAPDHTMVELHSNFTVEGSKATIDGVLPTNHAEHEAVEITQGVNDWFETGFYIFTSIQSDGGWQWVGDHIRLRFRIPESWHWPLGVSLYRSRTSVHFHDQQQQFFPAIDVDLDPEWKFNLGVGIGATASTDHLIIKCIIGRRFSWTHERK